MSPNKKASMDITQKTAGNNSAIPSGKLINPREQMLDLGVPNNRAAKRLKKQFERAGKPINKIGR